MPDELRFSTLEMSGQADLIIEDDGYKYISDSDAHNLISIAEKVNFLDLCEISVSEIINKLK